jgi:hypothetical protein
MCCDRFDDVDLTIFREGGWHLHDEAPVGHNWVTVNGDIDTLHDSFDELIDAIRDPADDLQAYVFHDDAKIIKNGTIDIAAGEAMRRQGFWIPREPSPRTAATSPTAPTTMNYGPTRPARTLPMTS